MPATAILAVVVEVYIGQREKQTSTIARREESVATGQLFKVMQCAYEAPSVRVMRHDVFQFSKETQKDDTD